MAPAASSPTSFLRCQVCTSLLSAEDRNRSLGVCDDCTGRPEARKYLQPKVPPAKAAAPGPKPVGTPPPFTAAEASLIAATGGHLPATDLLKLLNDRLAADRGPGVVPHTLEQLRAQVDSARAPSADAGWGGQRRQLARARKSGVVQRITPHVIDDFAIVFQLSAAQVTHLREAIASAQVE